MPREIADHSNPRSVLEDQEEEAAAQEAAQSQAEPPLSPHLAQTMRHVLAWMLEGRSLAAVATRAYIVAYEVSPDVIAGMTLDSIARMSGHGRSATHNLSREFEKIFRVRSVHARSEEARSRCSTAYHANALKASTPKAP